MSTALVLVGKPKKQRWCRYCERWIGVAGFDAHLHFKHLRRYLDDFRFTIVRNYPEIWQGRIDVSPVGISFASVETEYKPKRRRRWATEIIY
jgi:hypothetical protein